MDESIFLTIKKMLDAESTTAFDTDLKMFINAELDTLRQNGIGIPGIYIVDGGETWEDFLIDPTNLQSVVTFIYCRVKPLFDGTISSSFSSILKERADEALWRLKEHD